MFGLKNPIGLFGIDIGIDLGTANTLVWVKGKGIVIREPSVVAIHKKTKKLIALGSEAKKMLGKTPESIITIKPLRGGVISDFDATTELIGRFIQDIHSSGSSLPLAFSKPRVALGIPSAVTEVQRRAVWEAALSAGAREAFLIEEPMAAAIGEGISVFAPTGKMVVDIGGGTTEIAVISLGGIVVSRSLKVAGDEMDAAIGHYIRLRHGLLLGDRMVVLETGSRDDEAWNISHTISSSRDFYNKVLDGTYQNRLIKFRQPYNSSYYNDGLYPANFPSLVEDIDKNVSASKSLHDSCLAAANGANIHTLNNPDFMNAGPAELRNIDIDSLPYFFLPAVNTSI